MTNTTIVQCSQILTYLHKIWKVDATIKFERQQT